MKYQSLALAASAYLSVSLISGCSSAQSDWEKASSQNSESAYQSFITAHPQDSHAAEARAMVLKLQDNNAWQEAQNAGSTASYQIYLQKYPEGIHAQDAKQETNRVASAAAWKSAQDVGTAEAVRAFLQAYPVGPDAERAKSKLTELTSYRIQLANLPTEAKAQRRLAELKSRLGSAAPELMVSPNANGGPPFSIDSVGMSQQGAQDACNAVQKKHVSCQILGQ